MRKHFAFTMIELIFVIVIMGIIGKFGVEFLAQAYNSYIYSKINSTLQQRSEITVEEIARHLAFRIKDSVIARVDKNSSVIPISQATGNNYKVLEWIGYNNEGFRGLTHPFWSGIIDLDSSNATILSSPDTNTTRLNQQILDLSENNTTNLSNAALYFIGANSDVKTDYGWDGNLTNINLQQGAMHPIQAVAGNIAAFAPSVGSFSGVNVYEYYQLAWSAYAVVMEDYNASSGGGTLKLYWEYRPWEGEAISDARQSTILMKDVSTFQFISIGSIIKIQVCTKSSLLTNMEYSLCKEKTVF